MSAAQAPNSGTSPATVGVGVGDEVAAPESAKSERESTSTSAGNADEAPQGLNDKVSFVVVKTNILWH